MKWLLSLLALPLLTGATSPESAFMAPILESHQAERAAVGVPPLKWDDRLAADAARWGRQLARSGSFEHEVAVTDDLDTPGENLWMGSAGSWSPGEMVHSWAEEKRGFRNGTFPNVSRSGDWDDVGHYTQMVWRNTGEVGCALISNGKMDTLVCRYARTGNIDGERVY